MEGERNGGRKEWREKEDKIYRLVSTRATYLAETMFEAVSPTSS